MYFCRFDLHMIYITIPAVKYFLVTDVQGTHFVEERLELRFR